MQQSDLLYPDRKSAGDPMRISETSHTPELSDAREPAYAPDAVCAAAHTSDLPLPPDAADIPALPGLPQRIHASNASERVFAAMKRLYERAPRIHCLTNAVTMNDVANILLAIGGSAIMAQDSAEAAEITALCNATLLNTGTPSDEKFTACLLAGKKANEQSRPLVLDPVGVGASTYRKENIGKLLSSIHPDLIRCNLEEALTLLAFAEKNSVSESSGADPDSGLKEDSVSCPPAAAAAFPEIRHGGVESGMDAKPDACADLAARLAKACQTAVLISGGTDAISDGMHTALVTGGDARITRISGSGCMLSAICAALLAAGENAYDAALTASILWKQAAECAGQKTDANSAGMGSFHMHLFDAATNLGCIRI